jgi:CubicO group peptidase (beta-lactamase class C family)
MVDTHFTIPPEKVHRLAPVYSPAPGAPGRLIPADPANHVVYSVPTLAPSGGSGLVSTGLDFYRFATCLANGGELDGARILSRKTVEMTTRNQLPDALLPIEFEPNPALAPFWPDYGFGLGVGTVLDTRPYKTPASVGSFTWGGAVNTLFWVDPREALVGVLMMHIDPAWQNLIEIAFLDVMYAAIAD